MNDDEDYQPIVLPDDSPTRYDVLKNPYQGPESLEPRPPEPPAAPEVPGPDEWSTAHQFNLQRLNNSLAEVDNERATGQISPQTFQESRAQLQAERLPLLARKKAFDQSQQQEQMQQQMQALGLRRSVEQADAEHRAQGFAGTVATHVDPETGDKTHFYPKSLGMEPIPKKDVEAAPPVPSEGHNLTIWNGLNRQEVTYDANGQRTGIQSFNPDGTPTSPQAPPQISKSAARAQAEQEMGRARPPEQVMFNGRLHHNPATVEWDKEVGARVGRIETEMKQNAAREQQYHGGMLKQAFDSAKKIDDDAADPVAARLHHVAEFLDLHDPKHPELGGYKSRLAAKSAGLAAKDPDSMSLPELAHATLGPHTNVKKLLDDARKEVVADARVIPPDTARGDSVYNPADGKTTGLWKDMDPDGINDEAYRRAKANLKRMVLDKRKAAGAQTQPGGGNQPGEPKPKTDLPVIPAGAAALPALLAEKKRREQMKQPPPAVDPTAPVFQSGGF